MIPNGRETSKGARSQCLQPILPFPNIEIDVEYLIVEMGEDDLEEQRNGHTEATRVDHSVIRLWKEDILRKKKFYVGYYNTKKHKTT